LNPPGNTITFTGFAAPEARGPGGTCDIVARSPSRKREFLAGSPGAAFSGLSVKNLNRNLAGVNGVRLPSGQRTGCEHPYHYSTVISRRTSKPIVGDEQRRTNCERRRAAEELLAASAGQHQQRDRYRQQRH